MGTIELVRHQGGLEFKGHSQFRMKGISRLEKGGGQHGDVGGVLAISVYTKLFQRMGGEIHFRRW